jgi:hypothetical protein
VQARKRAEQRMKVRLFTLRGVDLAPVGEMVELGDWLAVYRAGITARVSTCVLTARGGGAFDKSVWVLPQIVGCQAELSQSR